MGKVNSYSLTVNRNPLSLLPSVGRPPRKRESIVSIVYNEKLNDGCGVKHGLPTAGKHDKEAENPQFPLPSQQSDQGLECFWGQRVV